MRLNPATHHTHTSSRGFPANSDATDKQSRHAISSAYHYVLPMQIRLFSVSCANSVLHRGRMSIPMIGDCGVLVCLSSGGVIAIAWHCTTWHWRGVKRSGVEGNRRRRMCRQPAIMSRISHDRAWLIMMCGGLWGRFRRGARFRGSESMTVWFGGECVIDCRWLTCFVFLSSTVTDDDERLLLSTRPRVSYH